MEWWQMLITMVIAGVILDMLIVHTLGAYGKVVLIREFFRSNGLEKLEDLHGLKK